MALNANALKNLVISKMQAQGFQTDGEFAAGQKFAQAIAEAVVEHLTSAGTVLVPAAGLVAPNGPVTGQATGTIS